MNNNVFSKEVLMQQVQALGASGVAIIPVSEIKTDTAFRAMCESNVCGKYGKCWMCPPDVGDIHELIQRLSQYEYALVYQTIGELEDSFDFEGMMQASRMHFDLSVKIRKQCEAQGIAPLLHLSRGGCGVCAECTKTIGQPCRAPEQAIASLEAYGINVSLLAKTAGMKYTNGANTVTYFGAILFSGKE